METPMLRELLTRSIERAEGGFPRLDAELRLLGLRYGRVEGGRTYHLTVDVVTDLRRSAPMLCGLYESQFNKCVSGDQHFCKRCLRQALTRAASAPTPEP